jgi:hypothetical protein
VVLPLRRARRAQHTDVHGVTGDHDATPVLRRRGLCELPELHPRSAAAFADQFEERVRGGALAQFASILQRHVKQTLSQHQNVSVRIVERREPHTAFDPAGLAVEANLVACLWIRPR